MPDFSPTGRLTAHWPYACGANYWSMDSKRLRGWHPKQGCSRITGAQVLAWVREVSARDAHLGAVADALRDPRLAAPYPALEHLPVTVSLPPWRRAEAPAVCPACRAPKAESWRDCRFVCGAKYWLSAPGKQMQSASPCPQPAVDHVLRVARAQGPEWIGALCDRALAAFHRSVRVIEAFGVR